MKSIALMLLLTGGVLILLGLILLLSDKVSWLGNLPGDFNFQYKNIHFRFPLATSILISIILTVVLNIVLRFFRK